MCVCVHVCVCVCACVRVCACVCVCPYGIPPNIPNMFQTWSNLGLLLGEYKYACMNIPFVLLF